MSFAIIGATGCTGTHFLNLCLSQNKKVKALIRNPDKLSAELKQNPNLEIIQGSFTEFEKLKELTKGIEYIVIMAKNTEVSKEKVMLKMVKVIVKYMKEFGVKKLLYQAGAFSPPAGQKNPLMTRILRVLFDGMTGYGSVLEDNDAVIEYLATETDIEWIVTRPGMIKEEPSRGKLVISQNPAFSVTYFDLAQFNYDVIQDPKQVRTNLLISYEKKK